MIQSMRNQRENCLICGNSNIEKLSPMFSRYQIKWVMHVGICPQCGHVQLSPLPTPEEVEFFNNAFLGAKYSPGKAESKDNELKLKRLQEKIGTLIQPGMKVLDIGAGEGWAMAYFQAQQCEYFGIEAIDELRLSLKERGATVISSSIYDDISQYRGAFDIIVFRHILEHLIEPRKALKQVENLLSVDGRLYLALPNAEDPDTSKGLLTSYFRPVHVSYFCPENVKRLGDEVGLKTYSIEAGREIAAIMGKNCDRGTERRLSNYYIKMKGVVKHARGKAISTDLKNLLKIVIHRLFLARR